MLILLTNLLANLFTHAADHFVAMHERCFTPILFIATMVHDKREISEYKCEITGHLRYDTRTRSWMTNLTSSRLHGRLSNRTCICTYIDTEQKV